MSYLQDTPFLTELTKQRLKTIYVKILILDKHDVPIDSIEGRVTTGSININGDSAIRRAGSLTFVASESDDISVTDVKHILSMNKRIKILLGMDNAVNPVYDSRIWFPLGVYIITQPAISHSLQGVTVNLSFKDKMCLLNGECGGTLPASVHLHEYTQMYDAQAVDKLPSDPKEFIIYILNNQTENAEYWRYSPLTGWEQGTSSWMDRNDSTSLINAGEVRPQRVFDIIQTLVANYGEQDMARIIVNDVPLEIKQIMRFVGGGTLFHHTKSDYYTCNENDPVVQEGLSNGLIEKFEFNEDVGYTYEDFTYPGELITGLGDNVANVLDKIAKTLGNFEFFYDLEGNFIFQEIKNYLNTSHSTTVENMAILDNSTYKADFNNSPKSVFNFDEDTVLISSYSNTPNFLNIKNDYHIWGKGENSKAIHYHVAIKERPICSTIYSIVFNEDGSIKKATPVETDTLNRHADETYTTNEFAVDKADTTTSADADYVARTVDPEDVDGEIALVKGGTASAYLPNDWRVELYLQGLMKQAQGLRPSLDEQELLDNFGLIYDFKNQCYKEHIVQNPNELTYFIDYLEPSGELHDFSVDSIGRRTHTLQEDNITKIYNRDVPNVVIINAGGTLSAISTMQEKCRAEGQAFANVASSVYDTLAAQTTGYAAQDTMRELLYKYTNYNEQISLQSIPIYFLDVNTRISVKDSASNIYGDYIIKTLSVPLAPNGTMNITASRAQERI